MEDFQKSSLKIESTLDLVQLQEWDPGLDSAKDASAKPQQQCKRHISRALVLGLVQMHSSDRSFHQVNRRCGSKLCGNIERKEGGSFVSSISLQGGLTFDLHCLLLKLLWLKLTMVYDLCYSWYKNYVMASFNCTCHYLESLGKSYLMRNCLCSIGLWAYLQRIFLIS